MERIGPWQLEAELARGGMGVVWLAVHDDGRTAALKTLLSADARGRSAFRREARALARVRHPGVVRILDHGEQDGLPWLAMERVHGRPLRFHHAMRASTGTSGPGETWHSAGLEPDGPTVPAPNASPSWDAGSLQDGLDLFRAVCSALAGLHANGLVHRDLKPENALVRLDGSVVLVDLGLAAGGRAGRDSVETGVLAAGTVAYMAPEQARAEVVDARADLYALGCMLFEWLTGAPPYGGTPQTVAWSHQFAQIPSVEERAKGVPAALSALVAQLLAKSPRDRPARIDRVAAGLESAGATHRADDPIPPQLFRPALAGREVERDQLRATLNAVLAGGGATVSLRATSGTGKTRLALELARLARHNGMAVHAGECLPGVPVPFAALTPLLEAVADCARRDRDRFLARVRGPDLLASLHPDVAAALDRRPVELPVTSGQLRRALGDAIGLLTEDRPRLLIIDDAQWADAATATWVRAVALAPVPGLFLLLTERPEALPGGDVPGLEVVPLGPLDPGAASQVAADVLGLAQAPAEVLALAGGQTPFHITEWLNAAVESGALVPDADGWRTADAAFLGELCNAETAALVTRRIAGLPAGLAAFLRAAAVLGRDVPAAALAHVAERDLDAALDALGALIGRWIVVDTPQGPRFAHDQLLERAYGQVEPMERAALHSRAAEALADARPQVRAHHLDAAGRGPEAALAWRAAATEAAQSWAWEEAERFARRSMALSPEPEAIAIGLWLCSRVLTPRGSPVAAEDEAWAMLQRAEALGDPGLRIDALRTLAPAAVRLESRAKAVGWAREAIAAARALGDRERTGHCLESLATIAHIRGQTQLALECALACVTEFAETSLPPNQGLLVLGLALRESGQLAEAESVLRRGLSEWRKQRSNGLAVALNSLGGVLLYRGKPEQASECLEEARLLHTAAGTLHDLGYTLHDLGEVRLREGKHEEALALQAESYRTLQALGNPHAAAATGALELEIHIAAGNWELARRRGPEILREMVEQDVRITRPQLHIAMARLALEQSDLAEVATQAQRAAELDPDMSQPVLAARYFTLLADLALAEGDPAGARQWMDQAVQRLRGAGVAMGFEEAVAARDRLGP